MSNPLLEPGDSCRRIQGALATLPLFRDPGEVAIADGLYFFYETGEVSGHAPGGRITRVGNHPRSRGTLVRRLRQHHGGLKNQSVFRKLVGGALLRREDPDSDCLAPAPGRGHWERQGGEPCAHCLPLEGEVSRYFSDALSFRCVRIEDIGLRNRLEERLIATLAACPDCEPSPEWLGRHAYASTVRSCGLWNIESVGGPPISADDLQRFEELVGSTPHDRTISPADPLSRTLVVISCSARKRDGSDEARDGRFILDALDAGLRDRLVEARRRVAELAHLDESTLLAARRRYSGGLYAEAGGALEDAHARGRHVVILSGGYGVLGMDDPIGTYDRELQTGDWDEGLLGECLAAYVRCHRLESVIALAGSSTGYARLLRSVPWQRSGASSVRLFSPRHPPGVDPRWETPRATGAALRSLLGTGALQQDWRGPAGSWLVVADLLGAGDPARSPGESRHAPRPGRVQRDEPSGRADEVWRRICALAGADGFATRQGRPVRYRVEHDRVVVEGRRSAEIPKVHFEWALEAAPLRYVSDVPARCWGPSYIFAILTDTRIADVVAAITENPEQADGRRGGVSGRER